MGFCFPFHKKKDHGSFVLKHIDESKDIPKEITMKIHVCGISQDDPRISNIFTSTINDIKDQSKGDFECHESQYYWIIKLYSKDLNSETFMEIADEIKKDRDTMKINIKQNTILYFEDNPEEYKQKNNLLKQIQDMGTIYKPRIIFVTKKKYEFDTQDNRFITNIIWNDNSAQGNNKLIQLITSTIWNIDCYFNERINEIVKYDLDESNDIMKKLKNSNRNDYTFNILLTGLSRAGKSSFINLMTGKLSALESNDKESVTSKLTEYFIYPHEKSNENNKDNKDYDLFSIQLIDSPGIVLNFNDESPNQQTVFNSIKDIIKDNSMNKIDIVLFFFREGNSLETSVTIFEKLNQYNPTVIFVINHSTEEEGQNVEISSTISFLKQNKFYNLAKEKNFILTNFKESTKIHFFGMKEIWKRIYEIMEGENPMFKELEDRMKDYSKNDLKGAREKMDKEQNYDNLKKMLWKNKIFQKFKEDKNILNKCFEMVEKLYKNMAYIESIGYNGKNDNYNDSFIYFAILIIEIGKRYGFSEFSISNKVVILIESFSDYKLKKSKKSKKEDLISKEEDEKNILRKNTLKIKEKKKSISDSIDNYIENEKYFKNIYNQLIEEKEMIANNFPKSDCIRTFSDACISFYVDELKHEYFMPIYYKYYQIYKNCFNYIDDLSNKEVWEKYEAEYINDGNNLDNIININKDNENNLIKIIDDDNDDNNNIIKQETISPENSLENNNKIINNDIITESKNEDEEKYIKMKTDKDTD